MTCHLMGNLGVRAWLNTSPTDPILYKENSRLLFWFTDGETEVQGSGVTFLKPAAPKQKVLSQVQVSVN